MQIQQFESHLKRLLNGIKWMSQDRLFNFTTERFFTCKRFLLYVVAIN